MALYFAYGQLMNPDGIEKRCPGGKAIGPAFMEGYRFIVTSEGTTSMVQAPGSRVHGVLWDVRIGHVATIDGVEALFRKAQHKVFLPVRSGPVTRNALVYFSQTARTGAPHAKIWHDVMVGATHWGFPKTYIEELKGWESRRQ